MYKKVFKPILFLLSPDFVHSSMLFFGKLTQSLPPARWLINRWWGYDHPKLEQNLFGIDFDNPIGLSAGFDKNIEIAPLIEAVGFGFETGGSATLARRKGNPRPWFHRLPKTRSLVVHAGMANHGILAMRSGIRRNRKKLIGMPLIISVAVVARNCSEADEDAIIDAKNTILYILQHNLAQAIEINISCPNVGTVPFSEPKALESLLATLDTIERTVPFLIKMPHLQNMRKYDALLQIITRHNIQGVTVANLVKERSRAQLQDELPESIKGGLSGAPTKNHSTALVRHAYARYGKRLIIIGVGGVFSAEDAYEKIKAGASLVGMITGMIYEGPQVVGQINRGLVALLQEDGFGHISEAVGADHRKPIKKK